VTVPPFFSQESSFPLPAQGPRAGSGPNGPLWSRPPRADHSKTRSESTLCPQCFWTAADTRAAAVAVTACPRGLMQSVLITELLRQFIVRRTQERTQPSEPPGEFGVVSTPNVRHTPERQYTPRTERGKADPLEEEGPGVTGQLALYQPSLAQGFQQSCQATHVPDRANVQELHQFGYQVCQAVEPPCCAGTHAGVPRHVFDSFGRRKLGDCLRVIFRGTSALLRDPVQFVEPPYGPRRLTGL